MLVFLRRDLPPATRARLSATAQALGVQVLYTDHSDHTELLRLARGTLGLDQAARLRLVFFFSPKDVEHALSWRAWQAAIRTNKVHQYNNLAGYVGRVVLRDLCGWAGKQPLDKFAAGMGVPMADKQTITKDDKAHMRRVLLERPEDFLRYAVDDARVLLALYHNFVDFIRQTQGVLHMADGDLWDVDTIPMTLGRLVADTFERWLVSQAGEHAEALRFCTRKLGYLDPDARRYQRDRANLLDLLERCHSPEDLAALQRDPQGRKQLHWLHKAKFLFTALDGCGVRWWASQSTNETATHNALVQGGRCHNEHPEAYAMGPGLDVDISSCYGTVLRELVYPVGLPWVWTYLPNEPRPTLGQWLADNEADLMPHLWTCTVSGPLPFEQDLLYSKLVKAGNIRKAARADGTKIPADTALLRREVRNALITHDVLHALRRVATNTEWAALTGLEVVTATAYRNRDQRFDVASWCRQVLAADHDRKHKPRLQGGPAQDKRPRCWYGVPLNEFAGKLTDYRKECRGNKPLANILKLLVNTQYGAFTCRHFRVCNTILANVITARGRVGVWMVAKALDLRQSITDGGLYSPSAVPVFRGRCPGLDLLSRMWEWPDFRHGRKLAPMAGLDWSGPLPTDLDDLALTQVRRFWAPYGLEFPFTLAHKLENTFVRAAYFSKADYGLLKPDGTRVYVLRGKHRSKRHPSHAIMDAVLDGRDDFPADVTYPRGGILKVGEYRVIQSSANGYGGLKDLRPGDSKPEQRYPARYNNTHMPLPDEATYLRRRSRRKKHRGRDLQWFERYGRHGIARVHQQMMADELH
jgi:hypothetical protein